MATKVGIQFYVDGAAAVDRDIKKIGKSLGSAVSLGDVAKGTLAFLGIRTSLRMLGREARDFFVGTIEQSPIAMAEVSKLNKSYLTMTATLQEWLIPLTNDFVKGLNRIADGAGAAMAGIDSIVRAPQLSADSLNAAMEEYRQVTGDMAAFTRASDEFGYGGAGRKMPEYPQKWADIQRTYQSGVAPADPIQAFTKEQKEAQAQVTALNDALDRQVFVQAQLSAGQENAAELMEYSIKLEAAYGDDIETQTKLYEDYKKGLEEVAKFKAKQAQADVDAKQAAHIAAAYRQMAQDMDQNSAESFQIRQDLLDQEYANYQKFIDDKVLLDKWYAEQKRKLDIEQAKASDDIFKGWKAGWQEMAANMETAGQLGADLAKTFRDDVAGSINDAFWESEDLGDSLEEVGRSMAKMVTNFLLQRAITNVGGSLFGSERGNAFLNGRVVPFEKGGVVSSPTLFPLGIMGEKNKPEGVLPLTRNSQGRLGVESTGSGSDPRTIATLERIADMLGNQRAVLPDAVMESWARSRSGRGSIMRIMRENS